MAKRKTAVRPIEYSEELGVEIAERASLGESLAQIGSDPRMPSARTMFRWCGTHPEFERRLDRARLVKADAVLDEALAISDEAVVDSAQASRQRTRVDARIKVAQMLNPLKYAARLATGQAPELPSLTQPMSDLELAKRIAFHLAKGTAALDQQPKEPAAVLRLPFAPTSAALEPPRRAPPAPDRERMVEQPYVMTREERAQALAARQLETDGAVERNRHAAIEDRVSAGSPEEQGWGELYRPSSYGRRFSR
jgi:hypothetical protein